MIASAQEYRFVTFAPGIAVDGSVMPKRQDRAVLRGEDAGFLLEAYAERYRAVGGVALGFEVDGSLGGLATVARGSRMLVSNTVPQSTGRFVKDVPTPNAVAASESPVSDFGMDFPVGDLQASADDLGRWCAIGADAVMRLFADMQALRTFVLYRHAYSTDWKTWTLSTQGAASSVSGYSDGPGTGVIHIWRSVYTRSGLQTGIKNAAFGNLTFTVPDASLVGSCRLVLLVTVSRNPPTLFGAESRNCWISVQASKSDGAFIVPAANLYEAAGSAIATTGLSRPSSPTAGSQVNDSSLVVSVSNVFAVCSLTDHTNIE